MSCPSSGSRPSGSRPRPGNEPQPVRLALAPGVLGAIVAMVGLALVGTSTYTWINYAVAILAIICVVFCWQGHSWWWIPGLVAVAVVWNPIVPLSLGQEIVRVLSVLAAAYFLTVGLFVRVVTK